MNEKIEKIKQQLATMLDKTEDTDMIANLTTISNDLDGVAEDYKTSDSKYRELLGNYKEVIKHTSFVPKQGEDVGLGTPKEKSLDDVISDVIKTKINNK